MVKRIKKKDQHNSMRGMMATRSSNSKKQKHQATRSVLLSTTDEETLPLREKSKIDVDCIIGVSSSSNITLDPGQSSSLKSPAVAAAATPYSTPTTQAAPTRSSSRLRCRKGEGSHHVVVVTPEIERTMIHTRSKVESTPHRAQTRASKKALLKSPPTAAAAPPLADKTTTARATSTIGMQALMRRQGKKVGTKLKQFSQVMIAARARTKKKKTSHSSSKTTIRQVTIINKRKKLPRATPDDDDDDTTTLDGHRKKRPPRTTAAKIKTSIATSTPRRAATNTRATAARLQEGRKGGAHRIEELSQMSTTRARAKVDESRAPSTGSSRKTKLLYHTSPEKARKRARLDDARLTNTTNPLDSLQQLKSPPRTAAAATTADPVQKLPYIATTPPTTHSTTQWHRGEKGDAQQSPQCPQVVTPDLTKAIIHQNLTSELDATPTQSTKVMTTMAMEFSGASSTKEKSPIAGPTLRQVVANKTHRPVNAKQYQRILKRREARARQEDYFQQKRIAANPRRPVTNTKQVQRILKRREARTRQEDFYRKKRHEKLANEAFLNYYYQRLGIDAHDAAAATALLLLRDWKSTTTPSTKRARKSSSSSQTYSNKGFSTTRSQALRSMPDVVPPTGQRLIARVRKYCQGKYGDWECFWAPEVCNDEEERHVEELDDPVIKFELLNKGIVAIHPGFYRGCSAVKREMEGCQEYRQYHIQGANREPRLHVLFSAQANACRDAGTMQPGYVYHTIKMLALPLSDVPNIGIAAACLGSFFRIVGGEFKTGIDVLIYRNQRDGIFWHSDDTQHEDIVVCLVVYSENEPRTLCIQPKHAPVDGDMQIELFPDAGDVYTMDGASQKSTVHSVLKSKEDTGKRFAIVMRSGAEQMVAKDSNHDIVTDLTPPVHTGPRYRFGNHLEEGVVYSRLSLLKLNGHQLDRRGVSGNVDTGCDAIIVSRVSSELNERDTFTTLSYFSQPNQGSGSLFRSFQQGLPVRVFRKGGPDAHSPFRPFTNVIGSQKYRYDGIYKITAAFDVNGADVPFSSNTKDARRFELNRVDRLQDVPTVRTSPEFASAVVHPELAVNLLSPSEILGEDYDWFNISQS